MNNDTGTAVLLALDPGETTGYVVLPLQPLGSDLEDSASYPLPLESGVLAEWHGIRQLIAKYNPQIIVAEQFRLYPGLAQAQAYSPIIAARVLGAIACIAEECGITVVEQSAAVGKSIYLPDETFEVLRNRHVRDAYRHGIKWLLTRNVD